MRFECRVEDLELYSYDFLEGEERDRVDEHLEICPRCREAVLALFEERTIVTFELSLAVGATDAVPEPDPAPTPPRRRRGRILALALAATAAAVLLAVVGVFSLTSAPDEPLASWTELADGSRYQELETALVRPAPSLRRLQLDSGSLLLDVRPEGPTFEVITPSARVKTDGGRLAVSVSERGTIVEVLEGIAHVEPEQGEARWIPPRDADEPWIVVVELDPDPDLLARIAELEARIIELGEDPREEPPIPDDPEQAIESHDWGALAQAVSEMGSDLREGRLPEDPAAVRRYLRSLEALRRLSEVAETPTTVDEVTRDPRTGPKLFAEVLRRAWPDAPETDIAAAETEVERRLTDYQANREVAETPAARAAAEEELRAGLAREVEDLEEKHGPPAVEVDPVLPADPVKETETRPGGEQGQAPAVKPADETAEADQVVPAPSNASLAASVLDAGSYTAPRDRVIRGGTDAAAGKAAKAWIGDMGIPERLYPDLVGIAGRWVDAYAETLRLAPAAVVSALEAELTGGRAPRDVPKSEVLDLRADLLRLQDVAEREVAKLVAVRAVTDWPSTPTFFLLE